MSNYEWNADQAAGERAQRKWDEERRGQDAEIIRLRAALAATERERDEARAAMVRDRAEYTAMYRTLHAGRAEWADTCAALAEMTGHAEGMAAYLESRERLFRGVYDECGPGAPSQWVEYVAPLLATYRAAYPRKP
jgi:hypothetical protein